MNNIKLIFEDKEILVKLVDNMVTKKLINELPIVLNFDDYSRAEKKHILIKNIGLIIRTVFIVRQKVT
ncbi:MAG: cyclophilin-like fold protein [Eubacteriales bacterium]|nr:cyclophilin-like fold protein [Eubacteriales bacterium]